MPQGQGQGETHHRAYLWLLAGLIVFIALAYALMLVFQSPTQPERASQTSAFDANKLDDVITVANARLIANTRDVDALLEKAVALAQKGSFEFKEKEYGEQAIAVAQQALALDVNNSEAYRIIGYAYEIMQSYPEAHAAYEKALTINPGNIAAISQDAHAYDLEGDIARAEAGYKAALAKDPTYTQALMGVARIELRRGEEESALARFRAAASGATNARVRAEAAYSAGAIENRRGKLEDAERSMRFSIAADSSYPLGWEGLGEVLFDKGVVTSSALQVAERNGLISQSFDALEHAIALDPNLSAAHYRMAIQLGGLGRTKEALTILEHVKTIVPKDITLSALDKQMFLARVDASIKLIKGR